MEEILDITQTENKNFVYAGFWLRVGAYLIDGIILAIVQSIIMFTMLGSLMSMKPGQVPDSSAMPKLFAVYGIVTVLQWLYFALMESSSNQGTIGKMAVGIKVINLKGERISFGKATGRFFAKIISALILLIGFLMVAFTEKKQGLHDQIVGTLVIKK